MDIFINERSFDNLLPQHSIKGAMEQLLSALELLGTICPDAEISIHSTFRGRYIGADKLVHAWFSDNNDDSLRKLLLLKISKGPYIEELLEEHEHSCYLDQEDHDQSAVAAAACLCGVIVSLAEHPHYSDGPLTVKLSTSSGEFNNVSVGHFVKKAEVRKCRRRYVPNPKHHPARARGNVAAMNYDCEYDPFTDDQQLHLRHPGTDMPDTKCQQLLDAALPHGKGKQLYAYEYRNNGRNFQFYEFQPDSPHVFHGYPVPQTQVPSEVADALKHRARNE